MGDRKTSHDSWERLEMDVLRASMAEDICGYFGNASKPCGGCPALASRKPCSVFTLEDVLGRAKALAGVCNEC